MSNIQWHDIIKMRLSPCQIYYLEKNVVQINIKKYAFLSSRSALFKLYVRIAIKQFCLKLVRPNWYHSLNYNQEGTITAYKILKSLMPVINR